MERAKIALFEDEPDVRLLSQVAIGYTSHEIVAEASTQQEALEIIEKIAAGELEVDVFLVDGQLNTKSGNGEDARIIHDYKEALQVGGAVVGFSAEPMTTDRCDVSIPNKNIFGAIEYIDGLPTPALPEPL